MVLRDRPSGPARPGSAAGPRSAAGRPEADEVVRRDRHPVQLAAGRVAERGHDRRRRHDRWRARRSPWRRTGRPARAPRRTRDTTGGTSSDRRDQVVGERRVADAAVLELDLLHQRQARAPARCRPRSGPRTLRVQRRARRPARRRSGRPGRGRAPSSTSTTARSATKANADVDVALAVARRSRSSARWWYVGDGARDRPSAGSPSAPRAARRGSATARLAARRRRSSSSGATPTSSRPSRRSVSAGVDDDVARRRAPCARSARAPCTGPGRSRPRRCGSPRLGPSGPACSVTRRLRRVVEALAVGDVLEADARTRRRVGRLAAADVAGAARDSIGVAAAGSSGGAGSRHSVRSPRAPARCPGSTWPVGSTEPVCSGVAAAGARPGRCPSFAASASIARLVREADLRRAEPAHRAARRVVRVDDRALDPDVRHLVRPGGERRGVGEHRRATTTRTRRRRAAGGRRPRRAGRPASRRSRIQIRDGWRCTCAVERLLAARTPSSPDGPVRSASRQAWICTWMSSREPNAPPTPASVIRTFSSGRPRHGAICWRSTWSHCVFDVELDAAVLGRDRPARPRGRARAWSCIARLVVALDPRRRRARVRVAVHDVDVAQHVAEVVHLRRVGVERLAPCRSRPAAARSRRRRGRRPGGPAPASRRRRARPARPRSGRRPSASTGWSAELEAERRLARGRRRR